MAADTHQTGETVLVETALIDLLEVKDGNLKTHPTLLENLVFLVEVCFCSLCEKLSFP